MQTLKDDEFVEDLEGVLMNVGYTTTTQHLIGDGSAKARVSEFYGNLIHHTNNQPYYKSFPLCVKTGWCVREELWNVRIDLVWR